jgi:hypothetical protein
MVRDGPFHDLRGRRVLPWQASCLGLVIRQPLLRLGYLASATREPMACPNGHNVLIILAAIASAVAIAACGSSKSSSTAAASGQFSQGVKYSDCMRSHGVSNFPDPNSVGGGLNFHIPDNSINPYSPSFTAARSDCAKLLPGPRPGAQHPTAQEVAQTLKISECMRRRGVSGFPDPTLKMPSNPGPGEYSILEDNGGVVLAVPSTISPGSPVFKQAAAACGFG